jgi:hypothetical protein
MMIFFQHYEINGTFFYCDETVFIFNYLIYIIYVLFNYFYFLVFFIYILILYIWHFFINQYFTFLIRY